MTVPEKDTMKADAAEHQHGKPKGRPRYGEYATEEEQRAHIADPGFLEDLNAPPEQPASMWARKNVRPAPAAGSTEAGKNGGRSPLGSRAASGEGTSGNPASAAVKAPLKPLRLLDLVASVVFTAFLVTQALYAAFFISPAAMVENFRELLNTQVVPLSGAGSISFESFESNYSSLLGVIQVGTVVLLILVLLLLSRRLRRGKVSFWVPLVGYVVLTLLQSLVLVNAFFNSVTS